MARKKSTKTTKKTLKKEDLEESSSINESKVGDSYISLALGAIVIIAIVAVLFVIVRNNNLGIAPVDETINLPDKAAQKTYVIQEGEGLWDVAVKFYGDGFKWVKLAEVNKIENPDFVNPGTKLIIPDIENSQE